MKFTRFILIIILFGSVFPAGCQSNNKYSDRGNEIKTRLLKERISRLDSFLIAKAAEGRSFSLSLSKGGRPFLSKGYSIPSNENQINAHTKYNIASIAKNFTATGIMILAQRGELKLDDSIGKFLYDLPEDKLEITFHQLLTMYSGLNTYHDSGDFEELDLDTAYHRIINQKLLYPPGTDYTYSNSGFTLLAILIERISGIPYEQFLKDEIFKKLGMNNTGFYGDFKNDNNIAIGQGQSKYLDNNPSNWPNARERAALFGNSGIISSTADMNTYMDAYFKGKIISNKVLEKAKTGIEINKLYKKTYIQNTLFQGYGWRIYDDPIAGKEYFFGGAGNYGFVCLIKYYEDYDVALSLFTNVYVPGEIRSIRSYIFEMERILFESL